MPIVSRDCWGFDRMSNLSSTLENFRIETRAWLEANCPLAMRQPMEREFGAPWGGRSAQFDSVAQRVWFERMAAKGWTAPHWPQAYGGGGLSPPEHVVLQEEMRQINARPPLIGPGLWMLGPTLLEFGTEEQKLTYLPPIARGEVRWCQGYSEPGAGSDLASVRTRAELRGDHYVVNGQKVWSSYADQSDWMFCLVRSEPNATKHRGISFLLLDLSSPGVTRRPIVMIDDSRDFCEVFFDDVVVPRDNLVGHAGEGWTIAKRLMSLERSMIGGSEYEAIPQPGAIGRMLGERDGATAVLRTELALYEIDFMALQATIQRYKDTAAAGQAVPAAAPSVAKLMGANYEIRRKELTLAVAGGHGVGWTDKFEGGGSALSKAWLRARSSAIAGGTNEIQLNIIAKHALKL